MTMSQDDATAKLTRRIDATRKAERFLVNAAEIVTLRRRGACELHRICVEFVSSVNSNLLDAALDLSPGTYAPPSPTRGQSDFLLDRPDFDMSGAALSWFWGGQDACSLPSSDHRLP